MISEIIKVEVSVISQSRRLITLTESGRQGSKKVPSSGPEQVDSPSGQVTFHSHLPNGQGIGKPSAN